MRIRVLNIFLVLSYAILSLGILMTVNYNTEINEIKKLSNSFYNEDSVFFNSKKENINAKELYSKMPENSVLYHKISESNIQDLESDIRLIAFKGHYEHPKLIKGKFFTESDFSESDNKIAVVGKEVETLKENGEEYYLVYDKKYKVVGKIGYNMPTRLDKTVMLPLSSALIIPKKEFSIYSKNINDSKNFINDEQLFGKTHIFDKNTPNILKMVDKGKMGQIYIPLIFISIILFNTLLLSYFWLNKKENEMIVKKMNGYMSKDLLREVTKEFLIILAVGIIVGISSSIIVTIVADRTTVHILPILLSAVFILAFPYMYFTFISRHKISKIDKNKLSV